MNMRVLHSKSLIPSQILILTFCLLLSSVEAQIIPVTGSGVIVLPGTTATTVATTSVVSGSCRCVVGTTCPAGSTGGINPRIVNGNTGVTCGFGEVYCCSSNTSFTCGISSNITLAGVTIVAGQANFGEFPWMVVVLGTDNSYLGGGVLIDTQFVLTAAHKIAAYSLPMKVRLGVWNLNEFNTNYPYVEFTVTTRKIHESYNSATLANDLAILKLSGTVDYAKYPHIRNICLPAQGASYVNQRCLVSGYGSSAFTSSALSTALKKVDVPILDDSTCETRFRQSTLGANFAFDRTSFTCAGGERSKDACNGDGGSPMVCLSGTQYFLTGLVAWGVGCANENIPGAYVDIPNYISWINTNKV